MNLVTVDEYKATIVLLNKYEHLRVMNETSNTTALYNIAYFFV